MDEECSIEENSFWELAHSYSHETQDEEFVTEMAYMMLTLHQTGN